MPKNKHAVELGKLGGKAKGATKRRPSEHYRRISLIGHAKQGHKIKGEK